MTLKERLAPLRRRDDDGAALVIALIFITVVAVVVAAVLALADTSLRTTVALRDQAANAAAADGAAQLAIDTIRHNTYTGTGNCFSGSNTLTLSNYYQPPSGAADSAVVTCDQDTSRSVAPNTFSGPGYALLSLGTSPLESGVSIKANNGGLIYANGDVGSKSDVTIDHGELHVTGKINAATCSGIITSDGPKNCTAAAGAALTDPNYAAPAAPTANGTVSACDKKITFTPGLYTDLTKLTAAWNCNKAKVYDFRPGIYYFAYSGLWTIDSGTMVAGAVNPLGNTAPTIPGACPNQVSSTTPDPTEGVEFVFGGSAHVLFTINAQVEICGRPQAGAPPLAFYGLKSSIGSGAFLVPAQNGCVTQVYGCDFLQTDQNSNGLGLWVQGTTYVPAATVDLDLRKSTNQFFNDGLVVRTFNLFAPASASPPTPLAAMPSGSVGPARTVLYLTVYICPGTSTCTVGTGTIRLRVKVGFGDPSGTPVAGSRQVTVYTWSVQR
jgi:hypothetical protein